MTDQQFDRDHDPHLLAEGTITTEGGRQRVRLTFTRVVVAGQSAELVRTADGWELRRVVDSGPRTISTDPATLWSFCEPAPWEVDDQQHEAQNATETNANEPV